MQLFISCIPGIEPIVENEVRQILGDRARISEEESESSGIQLDVDSFEDVMKLNLYLRSASRVLLHLFDDRCYIAEDLYRAFRKRSWTTFFPHLETFMIDAPKIEHPDFRNTLYAAQLAKDGICDSLKEAMSGRPSIDTKQPKLRFVITIQNKQLSVYFDTSLEPLHRRGISAREHEAPLRETLAASILLTVGVQADDIICDPCCGTGTLLTEAAMILANIPPGLFRKNWGFMRHPRFDAKAWAAILEESKAAIRPLRDKSLIGIDISGRSLEIMQETLRFLKIQNAFELIRADFAAVDLPQLPTLIVTNPPYGVRLNANSDLKELYASLGDFMKRQSKKPGRGAIFTTIDHVKEVGLKTKRRYSFVNGPLDCRLLEFDLF